MKKKLSITFTKYILLVLGFSTVLSCKKVFDIQPEDALEASQTYRNVYDADASILGIYGKFVGLADKYLVLNELRADLLDVTPKANAYLKQLGTHNVAIDNPYADPKPFYEVILNCNDALKNFNVMRDKKLLDNGQYYQRYTDILFLRSWLYLQLGIHYGNIPYVTDALDNIESLKDESKFPKIGFDDLLTRLIAETEATPREYLDQNTASASPTLILPMDVYPIKDGVFKFFIQRRSFLGDLNLWKGNYMKAASYYKDVMETGINLSNNPSQQVDLYDTYRVGDDNSTDHSLKTTAVINPWTKIFTAPLADKIANWERMWTLPFSSNFSPGNPLLKLFSISGDYLLKPSALSIRNWNNQIRTDGSLTDRRGLNMSYRLLNGVEPEVLKYTQNYSITLPFDKTGIWVVYRAAVLHMRYAEAANQLDRKLLAGALINSGIKAAFVTKSTYNGAPDVYPFDFNGDGGAIRGNWYRNSGIRGRAVNQDVPIILTSTTTDIEDKIMDEEALETAFEGYRWQDLLRIALRRQGTDPNYLANKIAAKFEASGDAASAAQVRSRLSNKANWYLPFKLK